MNKILKLTVFTLILIFSFGFAVDDVVELETFLNARTSPNFLSKTKNVATTLSKGTTGRVVDIKEFPTGNLGIQMVILSGSKAGQTYWVYQNVKNPGLKLTKILKKFDLPEETIGKAIRDIPSFLDPKEFHLKQVSLQAELAIAKVDIILSPVKVDCLEVNTPVVAVPKEELVVGEMPDRETPRLKKGGLRFQNTAGNNIYSVGVRDGFVEAFKFKNSGLNSIVPMKEDSVGREFQFEFNDRARSDARLIVNDAIDDRTSTVNYSILMFFPRKVLPSIKLVGDESHVTLPNGEIVKFKSSTNEIIGGVFEEGPIKRDPNSKRAAPAKLTYNGGGVLLRADKAGDLPYGDIERSDGSKAPSITTATISKKGFPDCKIPSKDIWYTDSEREDALIKPDLASDEGFNQFLKKRCSFSLF